MTPGFRNGRAIRYHRRMGKPSLRADVIFAALLVGVGGCSKSTDRASPAPEAVPKTETAVSASPVPPPPALGQPADGDPKASPNTAASAAKPSPKATKPGSSAQASCGQGTCGPDMKQK